MHLERVRESPCFGDVSDRGVGPLPVVVLGYLVPGDVSPSVETVAAAGRIERGLLLVRGDSVSDWDSADGAVVMREPCPSELLQLVDGGRAA